MTKLSAEALDRALQSQSRAELVAALAARDLTLTLPEINRLSARLRTLDEPRTPLRIAVLRSYATEMLRPYWEFESLRHGFDLQLHEAPFGNLIQEARADSALGAHAPDVTYIFWRWEDLDPRLSRPVSALPEDETDEVIESAIQGITSAIGLLRDSIGGLIVFTLLPRVLGSELGDYDAMASSSESSFRFQLKQRLVKKLREDLADVRFHDLDQLCAEVGQSQLFDPRLWLTARFPFSTVGAQQVVRRLIRYAVLLKRPKLKCILLDADNTLWGGIVGEDGPTGIALGPDYPGSAYLTFQRRLLDFQRRGFLLALCSKNNPADVEEILYHHPHQILKEADFAAVRVNWQSKVDNVRDIAAELNLGIDSFLFVDDSAHECLALLQAYPQMDVVQVPEQVVDLPFCLDQIPRLEVLRLTDEDLQRTDMYVQQRERRDLEASSHSLSDYLRSLKMVLTIGIDDPRHAGRIAQLLQKTNQFNLTTQRHSEADVRRFMADPDWLVAHFSLTDIFGDSGLVGIAILKGVSGAEVEVDSFLMSCRVIGREAERAFIGSLLDLLRGRGARVVRASYVPTPKNGMVETFWPSLGFSPVAPGRYEMKLAGDLTVDTSDFIHVLRANSPSVADETKRPTPAGKR